MKPDEPHDQDWSPSWLEQVRRRVKRWCAAGAGNTWVVAVSGGSDSVGLLRALHRLAPELGLALSVAHLDHGVRGEAARADAAFVETLASSLGLPLDLGLWQPARTGHFEADARRARYEWLTQIALARGAAVVAVGHTLDDQAETILHRIVRGTGLRGLAGMPRRRWLQDDPPVALVRPLLSVSRREIRNVLAALGQTYREDASNADLARTRARIRHDLLPKLITEYNPRAAEALVRLGALAAASEQDREHRLVELERLATQHADPARVVLDRQALVRVPRFLVAEVLRRVWRRAGWPEAGMSARRWRRLAASSRCPKIKSLDIGTGVTVTSDSTTLVLARSPAALSSPSGRGIAGDPILLEAPGSVAIPWAEGRIDAYIDPDEQTTCDETIDLHQLVFPLVVRAPVPGDRFEPLGMGGKCMPLNDFFRGRHAPRGQRSRTPLVCDQHGIVWVVGHRIADRVKVAEHTRRTLGLRWKGLP
jgi:tRNA(Ile)-lysidine synthase